MNELSDEGHAEPEEVLSFEVPFGVQQGCTELVLPPDPLLRCHIIKQVASLSSESKHELVYHDKVDVECNTKESPQKVWTWF